MNIGQDCSYFFGGLLLANALPHVVSAVMGQPFQTPFAKPGGEGFSSSRTNALWGWGNAVVGYVLLFQVGAFDLRNIEHVVAAGLSGFVMSLFHASHFGKFNGGNHPLEAQKRRILFGPSSDSRA